MPGTKSKPNPDKILSKAFTLKEELEDALCIVVKLIEMANEVNIEEWGQEVWEEEHQTLVGPWRSFLMLISTCVVLRFTENLKL